MSYIVRYGCQRHSGRHVFRCLLTAIFFLLFISFTMKNWTEGREVLLSYLLPRESAVAEAFIADIIYKPTLLDIIVDTFHRFLSYVK